MTDKTKNQTIKLGLIGAGHISESRSPRLHHMTGKLLEQDITYDTIVPDELGKSFEEVFNGLAKKGYRGVNITYPFKEIVHPLVVIDDPLVRSIGSVNTVLFTENGPKGFNTDFSGFMSGYRDVRGDQPPGIVCMIGTGGVGRAVAFGLIGLKATEIRLVDQNREKAENLADELRAAAPDVTVEVYSTAESAARGADGLINCTPVGMVGHEGTPLPREAMRGAKWAFDVVYTPIDTQFLSDAESEGLQTISGYELFFFQGVDSSRIFTGMSVDQNRLRAELSKAG